MTATTVVVAAGAGTLALVLLVVLLRRRRPRRADRQDALALAAELDERLEGRVRELAAELEGGARDEARRTACSGSWEALYRAKALGKVRW